MRVETEADGTRTGWMDETENTEFAQSQIDAGLVDKCCWFKLTEVKMRTIGDPRPEAVVWTSDDAA